MVNFDDFFTDIFSVIDKKFRQWLGTEHPTSLYLNQEWPTCIWAMHVRGTRGGEFIKKTDLKNNNNVFVALVKWYIIICAMKSRAVYEDVCTCLYMFVVTQITPSRNIHVWRHAVRITENYSTRL